MQRGYILLIAGGAMFVAGIVASAVWGAQFAMNFMDENFLATQYTAVEPGESINATVQATDLSRPLSVAIHVEGAGGGSGSSAGDGIRLVHTVRDPAGSTVSASEFSSSTFTNFTPARTGGHTLTIANVGSRTVALDVAFGYLPFQNVDGDFWAASPAFSGVIAGGVLTAVGLLTILAGIVVVVIDSRKKKAGSPEFSEGGVTYRKD